MSIHGNVVNVPADVTSTVSVLPRAIGETQTIPIKLKIRLDFRHHYQFQTIRPRKVTEAAKYLDQTSELFKNEGIKVGGDLLSTLSNSEKGSEFVDQEEMETLQPYNIRVAHKPITTLLQLLADER